MVQNFKKIGEEIMIRINNVKNVVCAQGIVENRKRVSSVMVYIMDGLLIDTGSPSLLEDFIPFFQAEDFEKVYVTHHHEDHTGGARWIQDHMGIPIYINEASIDICSKEGDYLEYRHDVWGDREAFEAKPLSSNFYSRKSMWEAIPVPGHSFDQLAFLNHNEGVMFTGDLYVTPKPKMLLSGELVPEIIKSLKRILHYDFEDIFCGHAGHVPNGKEMLKKKLDYMEEVSGNIIELYRKGHTVEEINAQLLPSSHPLIEISGGDWDTMHFITSVLSNVEENSRS